MTDDKALRKLMSQYGDSTAPAAGKNEDGEDVLVAITKTSVSVTTFQHNGWERTASYIDVPDCGIIRDTMIGGRWK